MNIKKEPNMFMRIQALAPEYLLDRSSHTGDHSKDCEFDTDIDVSQLRSVDLGHADIIYC